jgi:hypothetical protein
MWFNKMSFQQAVEAVSPKSQLFPQPFILFYFILYRVFHNSEERATG